MGWYAWYSCQTATVVKICCPLWHARLGALFFTWPHTDSYIEASVVIMLTITRHSTLHAAKQWHENPILDRSPFIVNATLESPSHALDVVDKMGAWNALSYFLQDCT
jgi:hypothetical protein